MNLNRKADICCLYYNDESVSHTSLLKEQKKKKYELSILVIYCLIIRKPN